MMETIVKHGIIFYAMGIMLAIGIFAKVISHITVRKMAKAASEIQNSNHKLMKLVKSKFEHASMVSDKVQNVEVFVKKYLYEYRVLGKRLEEWRRMQKHMLYLLAALGTVGTLISFRVTGASEHTFQHFSLAGVFTVLMWVVHTWSDEESRLRAAENYMVPGSQILTVSYDRFLRKEVNQRMVSKSDSSSGGSKTHTSSSGATHGGTGGKY